MIVSHFCAHTLYTLRLWIGGVGLLVVDLERAQNFRARVGLGSGSSFGFHEFVSKPVGLWKFLFKPLVKVKSLLN